jgi:hypothetical protein
LWRHRPWQTLFQSQIPGANRPSPGTAAKNLISRKNTSIFSFFFVRSFNLIDDCGSQETTACHLRGSVLPSVEFMYISYNSIKGSKNRCQPSLIARPFSLLWLEIGLISIINDYRLID